MHLPGARASLQLTWPGTSKYPPRPDCHGRRGEFLASLAALSLLSIASHHRDYRSHNSLTIHNSRVVARNIPAPPDQRVLAFASGTRVVVRDLFGSMPVRVKQRAAALERSGSSRDFDQLVFSLVALLLPWPREVSVTVQDTCARRTVSLRAPGTVDSSRSYQATAPDIVSRTAMLLAQASLAEPEDLKALVPIGATASGITVRGCVSLRPAATRRVQFIAVGVQPLLNDHHSNVLYEEVNRVFDDSSFGVIEEASLDDDGLPVKTDGFTGRELKPKRGVDRWPIFFLQILVEPGTGSTDVDDLLDDRCQNLAVITDLLQIMVYEFLKKHHFRPKSVRALEDMKRPKSESPAPRSQKRAVSTSVPSGGQTSATVRPSLAGRESRKQTSQQQIDPSTLESEKRPASPFSSWSRVKPRVPDQLTAKTPASSDDPAGLLPSKPGTGAAPAPAVPEITPTADKLLFDNSGNLLRKPLDDEDTASPTPSTPAPPSQPADAQSAADDGNARETVVWVDPSTKIKSLVDPRTGFAVRSRTNNESRRSLSSRRERSKDAPRLSMWKPSQSNHNKNAIFQPTEPPIPQIVQASEALWHGDTGNCRDGGDTRGANLEPSNRNVSVPLERRISRAALRNAEILGQVDQKFILAKVAADLPAAPPSSGPEADHLLIMIDQHAADERCRAENLLAAYFAPNPGRGDQLVAQTQSLDRPLRLDLSRQDGDLLVQFERYFAHWGIIYEVLHHQEATPQEGGGRVTVQVQALPPSILERCRLEPRLLVDLLRKEIWKLHGTSGRRGGGPRPLGAGAARDWVARFHDCPEGILDLINSRACRSESSPSRWLRE